MGVGVHPNYVLWIEIDAFDAKACLGNPIHCADCTAACHYGTKGSPRGSHKESPRGYGKQEWQPPGFQECQHQKGSCTVECQHRKGSRTVECPHCEPDYSGGEQTQFLSLSLERQMRESPLAGPSVCLSAGKGHSPRSSGGWGMTPAAMATIPAAMVTTPAVMA